MNKKLINIIESYKKSNINKIRLSYKLKDYYNLSEVQRLILITRI